MVGAAQFVSLVVVAGAENGAGHASVLLTHQFGCCPEQTATRDAGALILPDSAADGVWHCWPSTGRLTIVISTGAADKPPCSSRRLIALWSCATSGGEPPLRVGLVESDSGGGLVKSGS